MDQKKAYLKSKLVEFQIKIAELTSEMREQEDSYHTREKTLFLSLFEVLDAFENLDDMIKSKEDRLDKSSRRMAKNIRNINKKLVRILKTHHITPIALKEGKARMEYCKIADTRQADDMENETILDVIKKGYRDNRKDIVLRKAEVITVLNDE
ncbi:nucleotide exchange factor GrpE [Desulfococcaceae bacterium HSG9]|nr:nucleotide exchange factor GrpE [Desulfococcaceae bacterium HSG9]